MAKYGIIDNDLYNFNEKGFMMGVIIVVMVIIYIDRQGKAKSVQPGNQKQATTIKYINVKGWCILLFIIIQGAYYFANQIIESGFPPSQIIKPTSNRQTDNKTGLE